MSLITVYRAVPATVSEIRPGDWVAKDAVYCMAHRDGMADWTGEPWHVISAVVPESEVAWAGELDEWFADYGERREFFWRP